jgi:small subunit ribosomal protein S4e
MARLKRISAPKFWKIVRKSKKYTVSPVPGPHKKEQCLPISIVLRDYIKVSETMKETRQILSKGIVKVNGITRKQHNFPLGLMDILELGHLFYRIVPTKKGLVPKEIKDKNLRLCKVLDKKYIKGGKIQLNLTGGENFLIERPKDTFKTGDVIVFDIEKKNVKKVIKLDKGTLVLITGGKNMGELGVVESIEVIKNPLPTLVNLKLGERSVKVPKDYVFAVGEKQPLIEL